MSVNPVSCPKCQTRLLDGVFNTPTLQPCPNCATPILVEVFPAFFRPPAPLQTGEALMGEGEASCFYHPQKKAAVPCEGCGRFLCALCDVELNGQHLCPACLESGKKKGKIKNLQNERTLHDSIALTAAILPVLFWPLTFVTAPATIFWSIRHWNTPTSLIPRTKIRFVLAIIIAGLQITGWIIGLYFVFRKK